MSATLRAALAIRNARRTAGMHQAELAERIGTTQSNLSRLECGKHPITVEHLDKIALTLGVEAATLLGSV